MHFGWTLIAALGILGCLTQDISIEQIQRNNLETLKETLPLGWRSFCDAIVDEGVMAMYNNVSPSDATIHVLTLNNQSVILPIRALSELREFNIQPKRKTLLFVNGFYTDISYFSVQAHLDLLQQRRTDLNVVVLDVARNLQQLYYTVRHHSTLMGYFLSKILAVLIDHGIKAEDITLAGHSVGANIAAKGAEFYKSHSDGIRVGQFIAIDPARMCDPSDVLVHSNISERVVVVHGEADLFGIPQRMGTIDIYPNGIGMVLRRRKQPGCETNLCSHMYPFVLFMEALIEGAMVPAVRCDDWKQFRRGRCDTNDTVAIGLNYPTSAKGAYFCVTHGDPPFTFMEHGLKYKTIDRSYRSKKIRQAQ